jgi:alpha-tubulin suppressor-like RCC1 family protein
LVLSGDGSRLFWQLAVFDADLQTLGLLPERILASSRDGSVGLSQQTAFDVKDLRPMAPLPDSSTVMTVDGADSNLWYFHSPSASLRSVSLSSLKAPRIATQPAEVTRTVRGGAVYLSVDTQGFTPLSYQWYRGEVPVPGATNRFLSLNGVSSEAAGPYQLRVSNPFGTVDSRVAASNGEGSVTSAPVRLVIERTAPFIVGPPVEQRVREGSNAVFSAVVEGALPLAYQWFFQGVPIAGADQARLEVPQVRPANAGDYHLVASNTLGVATSTLARLTVLERPRFASPVLSRMGIRGQQLQVPAQVAGTEPIDVQWSRDGQLLPGQGATLVLTNLQPNSAGMYQVTASNAFGSVSETVLVVMHEGEGRVVAWGDSVAGQGRVPEQLRPLEAVAVAGGDYHSLALLSDGRIEGWGSNVAEAARPPLERGWIAIAAGGRHSLALHESGVLFGFGANDRGQTQTPAGLVRPVIFSAGEAFNVALTFQGVVFAWGDNLRGQTQVPLSISQFRPIPTDPLRVVDVVAGRTHALALLRNGTAVGWGSNLAGESLVPAGLPPLAALAAGHRHSVALTRDGKVRAWGDNTFGQTNVPPGLSNVVRIVAGSYHTYALRSDGSVVGWGDSVLGQVDFPSSLRPVASLAAGYFHGLAVEQGLPTVRWQFGSGGLRLLWPTGGILQEASSMAGPWTDVPTSATEWQVPLPSEDARPMRLFRLR